jgi:hypothetical protein
MKGGTGVPLVNARKRGQRDRDVSPMDTPDMRVSSKTGVTLVRSRAGHTCHLISLGETVDRERRVLVGYAGACLGCTDPAGSRAKKGHHRATGERQALVCRR